jgi:hypothetical protein
LGLGGIMGKMLINMKKIRLYILLIILLCSCYFVWRYNDLNSRFCGAGTFQGTMTQNTYSFGNKIWLDVIVLGDYKNICILDRKDK